MADKENRCKTGAWRSHKHKPHKHRKQSEQGFVLDCVNLKQSQLPEYECSKDKYMEYFFIRTLKGKKRLCRSPQTSAASRGAGGVGQVYLKPMQLTLSQGSLLRKGPQSLPTKEQFREFLEAKREELQIRLYESHEQNNKE